MLKDLTCGQDPSCAWLPCCPAAGGEGWRCRAHCWCLTCWHSLLTWPVTASGAVTQLTGGSLQTEINGNTQVRSGWLSLWQLWYHISLSGLVSLVRQTPGTTRVIAVHDLSQVCRAKGKSGHSRELRERTGLRGHKTGQNRKKIILMSDITLSV